MKVSVELFNIESVDEIVSRAKNMKEEIAILIRHRRITPEDVHQAILNWYTKVMQLIRRELSEKQFESVLNLSHPELELA